jgi:hypothetical protein
MYAFYEAAIPADAMAFRNRADRSASLHRISDAALIRRPS